MKKGFSLVEVMIVLVIIALLVVIALPNWLETRIKANENNAQEILKIISRACEDYAAANEQKYPLAVKALSGVTEGYLNQDYTVGVIQGYDFACDTMTRQGYSCTATPVTCNTTGTKILMITTGGTETSADCSDGG